LDSHVNLSGRIRSLDKHSPLISVVAVAVVANFISGLLNNINDKENNSKPENGHSNKTIFVETCTLHRLRKTIGKCFEKTRRFLSDQKTMMKSKFKKISYDVISVTSSLLRH